MEDTQYKKDKRQSILTALGVTLVGFVLAAIAGCFCMAHRDYQASINQAAFARITLQQNNEIIKGLDRLAEDNERLIERPNCGHARGYVAGEAKDQTDVKLKERYGSGHMKSDKEFQDEMNRYKDAMGK